MDGVSGVVGVAGVGVGDGGAGGGTHERDRCVIHTLKMLGVAIRRSETEN